MPISATQLQSYLAQNKTAAKMPQTAVSPVPCRGPQDIEEAGPPSCGVSSISNSSIASSVSRRSAHNNGQLFIASLTSFSKYFHPRHGLYRNPEAQDSSEVILDDGLPVIPAEDVEWLIVDLRYIVADDEWAQIDQQVSPKVSS